MSEGDAGTADGDRAAGAETDDTDAAATARGREVWIEKYRPESLDEIKGHEDVVERLASYVERGDIPHLMFAGPAGTGKCVTGETPVLTDRGLAPIGSIVGDADGFAAPDDGREVLTLGDDGEFEYVEPSHVFGKRAEDLVRVRTRDGNDATVTPEHRLLTVTDEGLAWTRAEELSGGERVARPLAAPLPDGDGRVEWLDRMDGDRTHVHVTESFARTHEIPFEERLVGTMKRVVAGLRRGDGESAVADRAGTTVDVVREYRRKFDGVDLDEPSTVCSLSYLRDLDVPRERLRESVTDLQYVATNGRRSDPIDPIWDVTPELARFLGLAIAEARIESARIRFYNTSEELLDGFETAAESVFGLTPRRGERQGVPYRAIGNRTLTHLLESCFDVFDGATGGDGIGSTILRADTASRRAFLRATFDSEAYVSRKGCIELVGKNERLITLLSYLLAGVGVPSRRKTERKAATNGTGTEREYHVLYVSGAPHLARFEERVGFGLDPKADRLATAAAREGNPNDDTIPVQRAVDTLCERLYLTKAEHVPPALNPETPGREGYLAAAESVLEAATAKLETAQETLERLDRLRADLDRAMGVPAAWVGERGALEPIATRRPLSETTGVRPDRLLEYADGRRAPTAGRAARILRELDTGDAPDVPDALGGEGPLERVRSELDGAIGDLGVPYNHVAEGTGMRGTDLASLLDGGNDLASPARFGTVADRVRAVAAGMLDGAVIAALGTLDRLTTADLYFDEVEAVERVDGERRVYDLTVPGTRNYVAGAVPTVMHNTTAATAIAKEVFGDDWEANFLELNASDERGIDTVRTRIKNFADKDWRGRTDDRPRFIFLDEADALCLPPGTPVVTGPPSDPTVKSIGKVSENGEPILSVDFGTNELQPDRGRLCRTGTADFHRLRFADGREVVASTRHPFFVVGEGGRLIEREVRDLSPGDEVADFRDAIGLSRCEVCDGWTGNGRFCSRECTDAGHGDEVSGGGNPRHGETAWNRGLTAEDDPRVAAQADPNRTDVTDGGRAVVDTVEVRTIEFDHHGPAYNITMEDTPNFALGNGLLTHNTDDAQGALRRTMEQFSNNVRFVLSCNYSSRIIDPIQSRCAVFRFAPLSDGAVAAQVREIADTEGIKVTDDGVDALAYVADGDMRTAINGLQAAAVLGETVDEEAVFSITSTARPEEIRGMVEAALGGDFTAARASLDDLLTGAGIAGGDVIDQMHRSVWEFDLDDRAAVQLLDRIGEADYRIATGANERIQLEALLASLALDGDEDGTTS